MTATTTARVIAFASPEQHLWGGLVATASGAALVLGSGDALQAIGPGALSLQAGDETWSVAGAGAALTVAPEPPGEDAEQDAAVLDPELGEPAERCTVRGRATVGGAEVELDCPALRFSLAIDDPRDAGSLRAVAGWFGPELALSLGALRPLRSRGHDQDRITATLFEDGRPRMVDEPRLSTTLHDDGLPARMSMELWVAEGDDLYPRRAAGEATATGARTPGDAPQLGGVPLTCHMAGRDGAGVYLLARLA
ncbi:MAG TPA: hypothetical protein VFN55_19200 [Solirubrobacteraceae bacterium]|nr:hypothetical protein [Solirubrobacteraceae bacterium]